MKMIFSPARALFSALVVSSLGLSLAGCGGGGSSGPTTTSPSPSPTTATPSRVFTPNYLSDIESLLRWRRFPVSVSFERNASYSAAAQQRALAGFDFWLQQIPDGPTLTVVPASQKSDIKVRFYDFDPRTENRLGFTSLDASENPNFLNIIVGANVSLGITGNDTLDIATAAHEYGHALGIFGHSNDRNDLMFRLGNDDLTGQLTRADINSMRSNYNGVFPKNNNQRLAPIPGPFKTYEIE